LKDLIAFLTAVEMTDQTLSLGPIDSSFCKAHVLWHCQYFNVTDRDADAVLKIAYDQTDSISAGFREDGYGYVSLTSPK
jgi:hypothetical protein